MLVVNKNCLLKPIFLALMGGKILLCPPRRTQKIGRTAGIAPEKSNFQFFDIKKTCPKYSGQVL